MPRFTLNIDTSNAAFEDESAPELARILRRIADDIADGRKFDMFQTIQDVNGNDVGQYAEKPDDYR